MEGRVVALAMVLALASGLACAGKVGLAVDYGNGTQESRCVEFGDGASAEDVLASSGLQVGIAGFVGFGDALCSIGDVGCPATPADCFCSGSWWSFSYTKGGAWQSSNVGIGEAEDNGYRIVRDGEIVGFKWTNAWGDAPSTPSFSSICPAASGARRKTGSAPIPKLLLETGAGDGCGNVSFEVKTDSGAASPFVRVRAVKRVYGPLTFGNAYETYSDAEGRASLVLPEGEYLLQAISQWNIPYESELFVERCDGNDGGQGGGKEDANAMEEVENGAGSATVKNEAGEKAFADVAATLEGLTGWSATEWMKTGWEDGGSRR
ncbi:MAG: hypothetical protein PHF51_03380 [Candidatus ainarchaeum sp.]|nr:hypothetical protein [Candidatus ainarchaeum sp.]